MAAARFPPFLLRIAGNGGFFTNVTNKFKAKTVTAVISITAETGSHDQADCMNPDMRGLQN